MNRRTHNNAQRGAASGRLLVVLLFISAVAIVLPTSITSRASNVGQLLTPFQAAADHVADSADSALTGEVPERTSQRQVKALRSMFETLSARNDALRRENQALTRIRNRGLGARGRLIPARLVAEDSISWRASRVLLAGMRRGVASGDGVLSHGLSVDLSQADGARSGLAVLSTEALVGTVAQVGTYTSRVRLLSDPETQMAVTIGRVDGPRFTTVGAVFWLVGKGRGRMEVRDVHHHYIENQTIKMGDSVLTGNDDAVLPPFVTIGTVSAITPDPNNTLLYTLQVAPEIDINHLSRVYIVDLGQ